jgi:SpoVK/Ycf46/Vps4 family AAA+-type ATPase
MDKIDKFIYINLNKREDRKKHILSELKKFNIPMKKSFALQQLNI